MTKATTKTDTSKKVTDKKSAKENLETANKTVTTQKVISNRILLYRYPKDCKDTLKRKSFRQKTRNQIRKLERDILKMKGQDRKNLKTELANYRVKHLIS